MITITVPIVSDCHRLELGFLEFALRTLRENSAVEHEAVVVTDDPSLKDVVDKWRGKLVLVDGPFVIEGRGSRLYEWLNVGARAATTGWVMSPVGDDSYFFRGWERLLEHVDASRASNTIWSPAIIETGGGSEFRLSHDRPSELQITWPHPCISEVSFLRLSAENCPSTGTISERPNERHYSHWAHTVQSSELFWRAGGYIEEPPWPDAHDLHLHDKYTHMGVTKVCVTEAKIGNCKCPVVQ